MYYLSGSTVYLLTTLLGTTGSGFGGSVSVYDGVYDGLSDNDYMVVGASKLKKTRVRLLIYIDIYDAYLQYLSN